MHLIRQPVARYSRVARLAESWRRHTLRSPRSYRSPRKASTSSKMILDCSNDPAMQTTSRRRP